MADPTVDRSRVAKGGLQNMNLGPGDGGFGLHERADRYGDVCFRTSTCTIGTLRL